MLVLVGESLARNYDLQDYLLELGDLLAGQHRVVDQLVVARVAKIGEPGLLLQLLLGDLRHVGRVCFVELPYEFVHHQRLLKCLQLHLQHRPHLGLSRTFPVLGSCLRHD